MDDNAAGSSGLGLAISRRISEIMGGDITVQSERGEGSIFTVRIPCWLADGADQPEADSHALETTNISAMHQSPDHLLASADDADRSATFVNMAMDKPLSVLIADDYDVNRLGANSSAGDAGLPSRRGCQRRRSTASTARQELRRRADGHPHAGDRWRRGNPQNSSRIDGPQPFIAAVTASAIKGDREKYLEAGMDAYISKPVDALQLAETLEAAFENRYGSEQNTLERRPRRDASGRHPSWMSCALASDRH